MISMLTLSVVSKQLGLHIIETFDRFHMGYVHRNIIWGVRAN